jgi:hypothetical protein
MASSGLGMYKLMGKRIINIEPIREDQKDDVAAFIPEESAKVIDSWDTDGIQEKVEVTYFLNGKSTKLSVDLATYYTIVNATDALALTVTEDVSVIVLRQLLIGTADDMIDKPDMEADRKKIELELSATSESGSLGLTHSVIAIQKNEYTNVWTYSVAGDKMIMNMSRSMIGVPLVANVILDLETGELMHAPVISDAETELYRVGQVLIVKNKSKIFSVGDGPHLETLETLKFKHFKAEGEQKDKDIATMLPRVEIGMVAKSIPRKCRRIEIRSLTKTLYITDKDPEIHIQRKYLCWICANIGVIIANAVWLVANSLVGTSTVLLLALVALMSYVIPSFKKLKKLLINAVNAIVRMPLISLVD